MLSLRLFLMILISLLCKEAMTQPAAGPWPQTCLAMSGVIVGFGLLGKIVAVLAVAPVAASTVAGTSSRRAAARRFEDLQGVVQWLWIMLLPVVMYFTRWVGMSRALAEQGHSQTLAILLTLAPTALVLMLWEWSAAEVDQFFATPRADGTLRLWLQRLRLGEVTHLVTAILPLVLIGVAIDLLRFALPNLADATRAVLATGIGMGGALLVYPTLFSLIFSGRAMAEGAELRARVRRYCRQLGVAAVTPCLIPSDGRWCGAAVVGVIPGARQLWLGDGLLQRLTDRQIDMVILHELAHLRRHHFFWRLAVVAWAGSVPMAYWWYQSTATIGPTVASFLNLVVTVAAMVTLAVGLGWVGRLCELDADQKACEYALQTCCWATGKPSLVARELSNALEIASGGRESRWGGWLHPCLAQRQHQLRQRFGP